MRDELHLCYQPQARIEGGVFGFEALCRWQHPEFGAVPPEIQPLLLRAWEPVATAAQLAVSQEGLMRQRKKLGLRPSSPQLLQ